MMSTVTRLLLSLLIGLLAIGFQEARADGGGGGLEFSQALGNLPNQPASQLPTSPEEITAKAVNAAVNAMTSFMGPSDALKPAGLKIIYGLFVCTVALIGVRLAGGALDLPGAFAELIKTSAVTYVAISAITPTDMTDAFLGSGTTLGGFITDGFYKLAGLDNANVLGSIAEKWTAAIGKVWALPFAPSDNGWTKFFWYVTFFAEFIVVVILKVLSSLALLVAGVFTMGHILMATIQIKLALFLAPILVPWLLFRPMGFLFDAWVKTLIMGGMLLFVGSLFAKGGVMFIDAMSAALPTKPVGDGYYSIHGVMATFLSILLGTILFLLAAMRLDSLASGVVSGSGMRGFSMHDFKTAMSGSGMSALGGGAKGGAKAAAGASAAHMAGRRAVAAAQQASNAAHKPGSNGGLMNARPTAPPALSPQARKDAYSAGRMAYRQHRSKGETVMRSINAGGAAGAKTAASSAAKASGGTTAPTGAKTK